MEPEGRMLLDLVCPSFPALSTGAPGSQIFGLQTNASNPLVLRPSDSGQILSPTFPGSQACRQKIAGLLGFRNLMGQSYNKSPHMYMLWFYFFGEARLIQ